MDSRQFNICNEEWAVQGDAETFVGHSCATPFQTWASIVSPAQEGAAVLQPAVSRGLVFASARWKYRFELVNPQGATVSADNSVRLMSALVVSPTDPGGAPLVNALTGTLPTLFNYNGDTPNGISILWRGMDFLSNNIFNGGNASYNSNVTDRYIPTERFSGRVKLPEGKGVFWVVEAVGINAPLLYTFRQDVSMSYRLGNL